jgi:glycosyltransferase involved in cell wall biosynthesis
MNTMPQKSLNILYLITKSNPGGAQKYIYDLAVAAKNSGHNVTVACGGRGDLVIQLREAGIEVFEIKNFTRDISLIKDIGSVWEITKIIHRIKPDILHTTSSKAGGIGALVGRIMLVPKVVFTSHGLTADEVWRPKWQRLLISFTTWLTLVLAHQTIMISTDTYERAKKMPLLKNKIALVKNGVSPIPFLDKKLAREQLYSLPKKAVWIGGMGELHPNKNWSAAILAMKNLPTEAHLLIIGEGEERARLEQLITQENLTERVHLLGYLLGAQYLRAFDIFILPSKKEGLPYVLIEAGQACLPVVASDLPGNQDIIETGETGFLVQPTPQLLSATLSMLVRDEGMRRRLGHNLSEQVARDFSIGRMLGETLDVYESNKSGA